MGTSIANGTRQLTTITLPPFVERSLQILMLLFIPTSIVAPHAIVWWVIIGGTLGIYYGYREFPTPFPRWLIFNISAIPLWACVTSLWAKYPLMSITASLKILALVLLGIYWCHFICRVSQNTRKSFINALLGGLFIGVIFLLVDDWTGRPWQDFWNKSSARAFTKGSLMISLATWPTLFWLLRKPISLGKRLGLLVCFVALISWTLFQIDCDTSFIAIFIGLSVFSSSFLLPRLTSWGMRLLISLIFASFPLISLYAFKPEYISTYNAIIHTHSYLDRINIWYDVATTIFQHPWQGLGMDGTRYHEVQLIREWPFIDQMGKTHILKSAPFLMHPHNVALQLWLELGIVGFILGVLLVYQILSAIFCNHLKPLEKAIGAGLFIVTFLIVWVSVGFWENWWISGLWIIIGLTITQIARPQIERQKES